MAAFTSFLASRGSGKPTAIAAHTVLGKGVSFMEDDPKWHHGALSEGQLEQALAELGSVNVRPDSHSGRLFADP
jgi:transketolase